jgi:arylsulfatase A-like enzyme
MVQSAVGPAPARASSGGLLPPISLLLASLAGALVESLLLARVPDGVFRQGPVVTALALAFLIWLWLSCGWLLWAIARGIRRATSGWSRLPRGFVTAVAVFLFELAALVYLSSWALQVRTGGFASFDALRYALVDYRAMTWFYVSRSEPVSLAILAAVAVAIGVGVPFLLHRMSRDSRSAGGRLSATFVALWILCAMAAALLLLRVHSDRSEIRRSSRIEAVEFRLSPWIAAAASWRQALATEPIEPILDVGDLARRDSPWSAPPGAVRPPIVFVKIESIRADVLHKVYQGIEIVPNLNALARAGVELTRAYSMSTHTDYSDVATLSSLYPLRTRDHHYYDAADPWPKTLLYDALKRAGYATALVSAENLAWGKMDEFLVTGGLDFFFDAERSGQRGRIDAGDDGIAREVREGVLSAGFLEDGPTMDVALNWIAKQSESKQSYFLSVDLQSPHFPYELPRAAARPFHPSTIDFDVSFVRYPYKKTDVMRNAYYNALHEADRQLGRLVSFLRVRDSFDDVILVVYGDHGEAFRENRHVTHGAQPIEVVVRVPCVIVAPRRLSPRAEAYPAQLIDLPPTVLALLGWPSHPNFQGIDLFARGRPPLEKRALFIHTENPLSHTDAVVLGGLWKYCRDRRTGREELYDLASDPGEARDLHAWKPAVVAELSRLLDRWRRRQLAYYHFPNYYEKYYPPPAPTP